MKQSTSRSYYISDRNWVIVSEDRLSPFIRRSFKVLREQGKDSEEEKILEDYFTTAYKVFLRKLASLHNVCERVTDEEQRDLIARFKPSLTHTVYAMKKSVKKMSPDRR